MAIGERSYPRDELSDRARRALRTAATMVADELFEDIRELASGARTLEDSNAWTYLPAKYRPRYTPELPAFVDTLVKHCEAHRAAFLDGSENRLRELRGAIEQAENDMYAYGEYAARKTAEQSPRSVLSARASAT